MKVYAYLRVSSEGQLSGHGMERQLDTIQTWADETGNEIERVFPEEGVSGLADVENRPAFQEMIFTLLTDEIDTVVVEDMTRLARQYMIQEGMITFMAAKGINLINARTGENVTEAFLGDPMRRALIQMQGVFAELEKNLLVEKLRKSRVMARKQNGRCEGAKPFGHTPAERSVIQIIVELRNRRYTLQEIAAKLNEAEIMTKRGTTWGKSQISRILAKEGK